MNVYDHAHGLARALKESGEYQGLLEAREKLESDPKNKEMLLDFRRCQWEMEKARVLEKDVDELTKHRFQQLAELVAANSTIQEYFAAEYRFGQVMADIQKILADALSEWFRANAEILQEDEE